MKEKTVNNENYCFDSSKKNPKNYPMTTTEECGREYNMKKHLMIVAISLVIIACVSMSRAAWAGCNSYTDPYGNTVVKCDNGTRGNTYTDPYGNTIGEIGKGRTQTYTNSYGNTIGRIGKDHIRTYTDHYGNTTGKIGKGRIQIYTDPYGNTTGIIDGQRVNCYADSYGNTICN